MNKLTDKQKELLLKGTIVLGGILLIIDLIFFGLSESIPRDLRMILPEYAENYQLYTTIGVIFLILCGIDAAFMYYLMGKVEITYKNIKSKRLYLNTSKYEEFEEKILKELYIDGYAQFQNIPNKINCKIKYLIRRSKEINDIVLLVRSNDRELSESACQNYFEISLNYIIKQYPEFSEKNINLIHIVCVDKVNDNLRKITESNVEQGYGRFNLPVGISFGSRTVYIATQKDGLFIMNYKKLVKMFKKYIKNQIIEISK